MDPLMQMAIEPVLADRRTAGLDEPGIDDRGWVEPPYLSVMLRTADGSGGGIWISPSAPAAERVAAVADQVQEIVIEELWELGESTSWPDCPDHPDSHPLSAAVHDGTAVWTCPISGAAVVAIGALGRGGGAGDS